MCKVDLLALRTNVIINSLERRLLHLIKFAPLYRFRSFRCDKPNIIKYKSRTCGLKSRNYRRLFMRLNCLFNSNARQHFFKACHVTYLIFPCDIEFDRENIAREFQQTRSTIFRNIKIHLFLFIFLFYLIFH